MSFTVTFPSEITRQTASNPYFTRQTWWQKLITPRLELYELTPQGARKIKINPATVTDIEYAAATATCDVYLENGTVLKVIDDFKYICANTDYRFVPHTKLIARTTTLVQRKAEKYGIRGYGIKENNL